MEEEAVAAELPTAWSEVTGNPPPSNMASPFPEGGWPGASNATGTCPHSSSNGGKGASQRMLALPQYL